MELILIRLTADGTAAAPGADPDPEIVADVIWAAAVPADRLEHLRTRPGPHPGCVDVALFHRPGHPSAADLAHGLCQRAITTAPFLHGFTARPLPDLSPEATDFPAGRRHTGDARQADG
jgi:hypothetical protein